MEAIIRKEDREFLTLAEGDKLPAINRAIRDEDLIEDCKTAMIVLGMHPDSCNTTILKAEAYLSRNYDASDVFFDGSDTLDVWIECWVFEANVRFVHFGIQLSDIWKISTDTRDEIRERMFVDEYLKKPQSKEV